MSSILVFVICFSSLCSVWSVFPWLQCNSMKWVFFFLFCSISYSRCLKWCMAHLETVNKCLESEYVNTCKKCSYATCKEKTVPDMSRALTSLPSGLDSITTILSTCIPFSSFTSFSFQPLSPGNTPVLGTYNCPPTLSHWTRVARNT